MRHLALTAYRRVLPAGTRKKIRRLRERVSLEAGYGALLIRTIFDRGFRSEYERRVAHTPRMSRLVRVRISNDMRSAAPGAQQSENSSFIAESIDVLYVSSTVSVDLVKDAVALREGGLGRVALLHGGQGFNAEFAFREFASTLQYQSLLHLAEVVDLVRPKVCIVRRGDPYAAAVAAMFSNAPVVYRPYDFVNRYDPDKIDGMFPAGGPHEAERFIIGESRAIYHMGWNSVADFIREHLGFNGPMASIHPGCMDYFAPTAKHRRLSDEDGELHVVYAAGLPPIGADPRKLGYADQLGKFRALAEQGIHLHVHAPYTDAEMWERQLKPYAELAAESRFVHIEEVLEYPDLVSTLTRYDYAYCFFDTDKVDWAPEFRGGIGNNVFTYLESGLPLITSPESVGVAEIVNRTGCGIVVETAMLGGLEQMIRSADKERLSQKVELARKSWAYPTSKLSDMLRGVMSGVGEDSHRKKMRHN